MAGATGAVGRYLIPMLVKEGHQVTGLSRSREKADGLRRMGAAGVVADALERLESGRLAPIVLPPGCSNWSDCESALGDVKIDFLWRIISFSEWSKARES